MSLKSFGICVAVLALPVRSASPAPPPQSSPTACARAGAALLGARLLADGVLLCFDGPQASCLRLDLASHQWSVSPTTALPPDPAPPAAAPKVAVSLATTTHVCAVDGSDCHTVELPGLAAIVPDDIVTNADRSRIIVKVFSTQSNAAETALLMFDSATGRLISTIRGWKTDMGDSATFQVVTYLGDTLYVMVDQTPVTSSARLYNGRTGALLGDVGGKDRAIDDSHEIHLTGNVWAFPRFESDELAVQDVVTGKRLPAIRPTGPVPEPATGFALLEKTADDKTLVMVHGDEQHPGVALVAVATRKVTNIAVPSCR